MIKNNYLVIGATLALLGMNTSSAASSAQNQNDETNTSRSYYSWGGWGYPDEDDDIIWGYEKSNGPDKWAELDPAFKLCGTGMTQSPIDISPGEPSEVVRQDLPDVLFNYGSTPIDLLNTGRHIELQYEPGSFIDVSGHQYDLNQVHFHSLSEHTVGQGAHFPMEMHLAHEDAAGKLVVVTVFIREGEENQALKQAWHFLPLYQDQAISLPFLVNIADALPTDRRTYRYKGSFTTPPCAEGVKWIIFREPIEMSRQQIGIFRKIQKLSCCFNNNRPTQPLYGRTVVFDTTTDTTGTTDSVQQSTAQEEILE